MLLGGLLVPSIDDYSLPVPKKWQDLEDLVWDLYKEIWHDPDAQKVGTFGQSQNGVDIFGHPNRCPKLAGVQVKRRETRLTPKELELAVEAAKRFTPPLDEFTIVTSAPNDAKIQQKALDLHKIHHNQNLFSITVFGWDEIERRLFDHPIVLRKYYPHLYPKSGGFDPEPGPHQRELFYFGTCLRDRLGTQLPSYQAAESFVKGNRSAMWNGRGASPLSASTPHSTEETSVEGEWGFGRYDARTHSLFSFFKEHLTARPCWAFLEVVEQASSKYGKACQRAYCIVLQEIQNQLPRLEDATTRGMAESLLLDAYYKLTTPYGLEFSYKPQKVQERDEIVWYLQLGAWQIGREPDPNALCPLAIAHQNFTTVVHAKPELKALVKARHNAHDAIKQFQKSLTPDSLLRKLVLSGRCQLCPQ